MIEAPLAGTGVDGDESAARPGEVREHADHEAARDRESQGERQRESRGSLGIDPSGEHPSQPGPFDRLLGHLLGCSLRRLLPDHGRRVPQGEERHENAPGEGDEREHEERHRR